MLFIARRRRAAAALAESLIGLLFVLHPVSASAQEAGEQAASSEDSPSVPLAPVRLDGETLFRVRGVAAYPAEQRAGVIAGRILAIARNRSFPARNIRVNETPLSTQILAGNTVILNLFDADARPEQVRREILATVYLSRIQGAVEQYRRERQTDALLKQAGRALAALAGLVVVWLLGMRLVRSVLRNLERRYKHRIGQVGIQSLNLLTAERIWGSLITAIKTLATAAAFIASYIALNYILSVFPFTRELGQTLSGLLLNPVRTLTGSFVAAIPNLVFLLILGLAVYYLLKFIRLVFAAIENETITAGSFDPAWAKPTYRLIRGLIIAFALVVAFPYIPGSNTQAFKGVSLFIGLVFSLGSTSLIGNLVSGYSLTYRRVFKPGDRVQIGQYVGDVVESRLLVTYLHTTKNEVIAVPNSSIVNDAVLNYSSLARTKGLILHTTVGIGYETPWRQVEAMLMEAAARTPGLLREPKPFVRENELRSFDVEYELNAYCDTPNAMTIIYAALHRNVLDVFNEYGVQIMTPSYESDPADIKVVARDRWYAAPAVPE